MEAAGKAFLALQPADDARFISFAMPFQPRQDAVARDALMRLYCLDQTARWTAQRSRAARLAGRPPGPEGSIGKMAFANARAVERANSMFFAG